jgi:hypothetical protein
MFKQIKFRNLIIATAATFLILFGLAACTPKSPVVEPPPVSPETETAAPTATDMPAASPTPEAEPKVLLVLGTDADPYDRVQTQTLLESLTAEAALDLVVLEMLTPEMITPEVEAVIGVGTNLDINGLALGAPNISFAVLGDPSATVADNVSVIGDPLDELRQKAFLAGYISAVISTDNKIVAFVNAESETRELVSESYELGARFYCGICHPVYPPYNPFPQWEALSPESINDGFRPIVNNYFNIGVEIVFVQGEAASPALLAYFEELGMKVIGDQSPDVPRSNWVATITTDPSPALERLWPDLIYGAVGVQIPSTLVLVDTDMGLISEGRYRLIEGMIAELQTGMVSVESFSQ